MGRWVGGGGGLGQRKGVAGLTVAPAALEYVCHAVRKRPEQDERQERRAIEGLLPHDFGAAGE